ncbi:MAG TPA: hypothetical protein VJT82_04075 [Pyrinomonadaceae bacterium]|nr:hypothetical protein [Pyrinomonadaceae bacterium]
MDTLGQFRETLATYRRHGWQLARVLMRPATLAALRDATGGGAEFENVAAREASFDAMWFERPAQGGREAWELRLVAQSPYALFELFEPDEAEEDREDVRREMEAKMDERLNAGEKGETMNDE